MNACPFKVGDRINYKPMVIATTNENGEIIHSQEYPSSWPIATVVAVEINGFRYEYDKPYVIHHRLNMITSGGFAYPNGYHQWQKITS